jgi:hypothetical protein
MNLRQIVVAAGAFACLLSAGALAQDSNQWVPIKDPQELRAIYSNKTFHPKGAVGVVYYRADGRALVVWPNKRFSRTWEVKGQQVCITDAELGTSCFELQRNKANPNEIIARDVKTHAMVAFTVEDGVPDF